MPAEDFFYLSPGWLFLFAILGFIGFVMAVQSFFQINHGRPFIKLEFKETNPQPEYRFLKCLIFNEPITKGWLKAIGVRRDVAQDVMATFSIQEAGSKTFVTAAIIPQICVRIGEGHERITLAASPVPAHFPIVTAFLSGEHLGKVMVQNPHSDLEPKSLNPGLYIAKVMVIADGEQKTAKIKFEVKPTYPFASFIQ